MLSIYSYPGEPANPDFENINEDYKGLKQVSHEYLRFKDKTLEDGTCIEIMTELEYGKGGYTKENVELFKKNVDKPYNTLSGTYHSGFKRFIDIGGELYSKSIDKIINFCNINNLNLDVNIEQLSNFSNEDIEKYIQFLNDLGNRLKEINKKFRITTIAEDGTLYHGNWRNSKLNEVKNYDYIVLMVYDRMYDFGKVGISPYEFIIKCLDYVENILDKNKIIVGLPNYAYEGNKENPYYNIKILTKNQLTEKVNIEDMKRDNYSGELTIDKDDKHYYFSDSLALDLKGDICLKRGFNKFSIWHLGGNNEWFSNSMIVTILNEEMPSPEPPINPPTDDETEEKILHILNIKTENRNQVNTILDFISKLTKEEYIEHYINIT